MPNQYNIARVQHFTQLERPDHLPKGIKMYISSNPYLHK